MDALSESDSRSRGRSCVEADLVVPNRPDVIDEVFDGEAVIVNLRSGCYYALNGPASEVWALVLTSARSAKELVREISVRHALDGERTAAVERFVDRLQAEGLAVTRRGTAPETGTPPQTEEAGNGFGIPEITRFDDMQDLLLLDPIHDLDLDGDGWPLARDERRVE